MATTIKKRKTLRQGGQVLRKGISSHGSFGEGYWDSLKWKAVDVSGENLGDFGDSVFLGLEELDASAFLPSTTSNEETSSGKKKKDKTKKRKHEEEGEGKDEGEDNKIGDGEVPEDIEPSIPQKKSSKKKKKTVSAQQQEAPTNTNTMEMDTETERSQTFKNDVDTSSIIAEAVKESSVWGSQLSLSTCMVNTLLAQDFAEPTPIQQAAIQITRRGLLDIVGVAETGSGKTLAFTLPIIESILLNWSDLEQSNTPFALVITPTRELALQISNIFKDVSSAVMAHIFKNVDMKKTKIPKIHVTSIIGGFSDLKQRRLLSESNKLHVIIATPGRLLELMNDISVSKLQDLSGLRYLVVDEADRIMEDGHFAEVRKIMEVIRDHESIAAKGQDVRTVLDQRQRGDDVKYYSDEEQEDGEESNRKVGEVNLEEYTLPPEMLEGEMPSGTSSHEKPAQQNSDAVVRPITRQTLLFSATAIERAGKTIKNKKQQAVKLHGTVRGLVSGYALNQPIKELLSAVGTQKIIEVVDATHFTSPASQEGSNSLEVVKGQAKKSKESEEDDKDEIEMNIALPSTLKQLEIHCTNEDKDVFTYYYLYKNLGRSLIFVNSIKCAKRLLNILTVLGLSCHALHADMEQKQRVSTLESYSKKINSCLIATDVAARGLDIKNINHVLHYDIARTPQLYVHRSGRTARANAKGTSISIVTPEDNQAHIAICTSLIASSRTGKKIPSFPKLEVDLSLVGRIRDRVKLAKKIFNLSHKLNQQTKETNWIKFQAKQSELDLDEELLHETGHSADQREQQNKQKAELRNLRQELKVLLTQPIELDTVFTASGSRAGLGSMQSVQDWKKRGSFFVYAK
eukprot:gene7977-8798_t